MILQSAQSNQDAAIRAMSEAIGVFRAISHVSGSPTGSPETMSEAIGVFGAMSEAIGVFGTAPDRVFNQATRYAHPPPTNVTLTRATRT